MNCQCNVEAKLVTVKKEGANQGRRFWACAKPRGEQCDFFCWEGETPRAVKQRGERENLEAKVLASINNKLDKVLEMLASIGARTAPEPSKSDKPLPF